ncbi:MAG: oxidoreductase [Clostridium sp.]|nr:oxidoreductase [Clostridium sp.]
MSKRWHTHVFTSTYTADVSGVCSAMYELGGMTILHDPSGCNSTYTTHDEPRWYDTDSLMFVSGLDEMTAVMGDDSVIIADAVRAAEDLKPRFITLCGASIPHIIAFDFKGVARMIEKKTGIPVIPVATDGLKSYVSGVGLATREWIRRFGDRTLLPAETSGAGGASGEGASGKDGTTESGTGVSEERLRRLREYGVNLLGVTPIDFSRMDNVNALKKVFTDAGIPINTCFAMGDSFENLQKVYRGAVNMVVSSAGRIPARYLMGTAGIPWVEGLPVGPYMAEKILQALEETARDGICRRVEEEEHGGPCRGEEAWGKLPGGMQEAECKAAVPGRVLIIGEEVFARSLAMALNAGTLLREQDLRAEALWPDVDEGLDEDMLMEAVNASRYVIGDPLFRTVLRNPETKLIPFPHEGYSGRIFRKDIPVFAGAGFEPEAWLAEAFPGFDTK